MRIDLILFGVESISATGSCGGGGGGDVVAGSNVVVFVVV